VQVMKMMSRLLSDADAIPPRLMIDDALPAQDLDGMGAAGDAAIRMSDFGNISGATIEDLMPQTDIARIMDRVERRPEKLFANYVVADKPVVQQILDWAAEQNIVLVVDWRLKLAERVRKWILADDDPAVEEDIPDRWLELMKALDAA